METLLLLASLACGLLILAPATADVLKTRRERSR